MNVEVWKTYEKKLSEGLMHFVLWNLIEYSFLTATDQHFPETSLFLLTSLSQTGYSESHNLF